MKKFFAFSAAAALSAVGFADGTYHSLAGGNLFQDWSNTGLITVNDDWSGVTSFVGYLGQNDTSSVTGVDPRTILGIWPSDVVDVIANQANPNTLTNGGVAEFEIADAVVALQGSGTADSPFLMAHVDATGMQDVTVSYRLRDVDGGSDNSVQQFVMQYRVGTTGDFTNVDASYVADASFGPSLTGEANYSFSLGSDANGASQIQIRWMTTNAPSNDEWLGIDDINITANPVPEPVTMLALGLGAAAVAARRRRK